MVVNAENLKTTKQLMLTTLRFLEKYVANFIAEINFQTVDEMGFIYTICQENTKINKHLRYLWQLQ